MPPESTSIDNLIGSLESALQSGADDTVVGLLVQLGARLRSAPASATPSTKILAWIARSNNPKLLAMLTYALAAYGSIPEGLLARLIASPAIPTESVAAIAVASTLSNVPDDWSAEKQVSLWTEFFLMYPDFLPGLLKAYHEKNPDANGSRNELVQTIRRNRLSDPASIDAVFSRVRNGEANAAWMLTSLYSVVALDDPYVVSQVSNSLGCTHDEMTRQALLLWLTAGRGPSDNGSAELYRVYCNSTSSEERSIAGTAMIVRDPESADAVFRNLWSLEADESVQVALVHALGSLHTNVGLVELQRVYVNGSSSVKEAVRQVVQGHVWACPDSAAARLLFEQVGPPAHVQGQTPPSDDLIRKR